MKKSKRIFAVILISFATACNHSEGVHRQPTHTSETKKIFSKHVGDTFYVSTSVPDDHSKRYPVVVVIDANLYFKPFAAIVKQYSEVGLIPECIVVGVGYKDFGALDTMRDKHYIFPPTNNPADTASKMADKFYKFVCKELMPDIHSNYPTDKRPGTLFGHSLGGLFTTFALARHLEGHDTVFRQFIAGSPSLETSVTYILEKLSHVEAKNKIQLKLLTTYGSLEDAENAEDGTEKTDTLLAMLKRSLEHIPSTALQHREMTFTNLSHMETGIPTFMKME